MASEPPAKKMRVADLLGVPTSYIAPDESATLLTADGTWAAAEAITKQIPSEGIPLTILTGFLGAGKSTVLNYILKSGHGLRIAVLINEFGEVDIDNQLVDTAQQGAEGEPVTLNNGCICCTISNGFIDAVRKILARPGPQPHYFIVETTGLADPKPIMDSITATELRQEFYLDQVLTVIDSSSWDENHYESDTAFKQLQFADTILLSKTDLASPERVKDAIECITEIRPNARVLRSQKGYVPIAALFDLNAAMRQVEEVKKLEAPGAKEAENAAGHDHKHGHEHGEHKHGEHKHGEHKHEHGKEEGDCGHHHAPGEKCEHTHKDKGRNHLEEEGFSSISFTSDKPFSLRRFRDNFMEELPPGVFRAKGLLWFRHYDTRFVFHWSGARYNVEQDEWPDGVTPNNQLVIIGRNLDPPMITRMLDDCILREGEEDSEEEDEYGDEAGMYGEYGDDEGIDYSDEGIEGVRYDEDGMPLPKGATMPNGALPVQQYPQAPPVLNGGANLPSQPITGSGQPAPQDPAVIPVQTVPLQKGTGELQQAPIPQARVAQPAEPPANSS